MKIAIMQPYMFPYIGYFQLINAVDIFGIGDDVQYSKSSWVNRNRILSNGDPKMFTFSLKNDSYKKIIRERYFSDSFDLEKEKFLRILKMHYSKAPFYSETIILIENIFKFEEINVAKFIEFQLCLICEHLKIETSFINSSTWDIGKIKELNVENRVILKLDKLKKTGINHFINPIGGTELYGKEFFRKSGYDLNFIKTREILYKQFSKSFVENLSIIDVMMFNSKDKIKKMLNSYDLI